MLLTAQAQPRAGRDDHSIPPIAHVKLLGNFSLVYGEEPVGCIDTPRLQSLFVYLILHRGAPQARRHIAFQFWPDSTEKQALTNLRHLLHDLRRALPGAEYLISTGRRTLAWRHDAPFTLDVLDFEQALANSEWAARRAEGTAGLEFLRQAVDLYHGDLVPGCYDEWIEPKRNQLREDYSQALERTVRLLEDRREYATAIFYARRLQQTDNLREASYTTLMRLYALQGDRAAALHVFDECARVLRRELDVAPGPSIRSLHESLFQARVPAEEQNVGGRTRHAEELPLVGRHVEWAKMRTAWQAAVRGRAHLLLVKGEAGIGKTRLVEELVAWAGRQGTVTARSRSYAAEGQLSYAPVVEWLREGALRSGLHRLETVWLSELSRLLPELLSEHPNLPQPQPITEGWQRLRLFQALCRGMHIGGSPLLLTLDDMQWADAETLGWLRYLLRSAPGAQLLVAGTARLEEMAASSELTTLLTHLLREDKLLEIELGPLDEPETVEVAALVAGRQLSESQAEQLYRESEGHPLYVVERVRAGGLDDARLDADAPPRVQALFVARLRRLSRDARHLASLAACIRRPFTIELLDTASGLEPHDLAGAIDELWQNHILREHGASLDFSHDKLRAAAYHEVGPGRRRLLHRRLVHALETAHAGDHDSVSGELAMHCERAGLIEKAIRYHRRAGEVAREVHANEEAIRCFRNALALLERCSDTAARHEDELDLRLALGTCLVARLGYGVSEARQVYERASFLCRRLGRTTEAPILRALANANLKEGHLKRAYELGGEIRQLARATRDPVLEVEAQYTLGVASFWMGQFEASRRHLETAIQQYDPQRHGIHVALYAQNPKVTCLCRLGRTLWYLGLPEQGLQKTKHALALAKVLGHPHSSAYALWAAGHFYLDFGDRALARACADELNVLASEHSFALWAWYGSALHGAVLVDEGESQEAIASLCEGIIGWTETGGGRLSVSQYQGYLAEAHLKAGAPEASWIALSDALLVVEDTGERFHEAELYRLKAALLEDVGGAHEEITSCLRRALHVAREQRATMLELRAATGLGRLLHRLGRVSDARRLLQDVRGRFTEGFSTPDLAKADSLLEAWA